MANMSSPAEGLDGTAQLGKAPSKTDEEAMMSEVETEHDGGSAVADGLSITQGMDLAKFVDEHIFKTGDIVEDNEALLQKIRKRLDDIGIEQPEVEVRYQGLTVEAKVHVGSRGSPSLLNTSLDIIETFLSAIRVMPNSKKEKITILDSVDGILKPGRMTLLLGPPGSGKSTLLQALANQSDSSLKVYGEITYNGFKFSEFQPRKTSTYTSQDNVHIPDFTPRETMGYAAIFQGVGAQKGFMSRVIEREEELGIQPDPDVDAFMKASVTPGVASQVVTEYYMKLLGLEVCADTIVGDDMRKGLSGGQIKRLTTGEMVVSPSPVLFMDDISTGLDSSTTFQIVKCMGQFATILRKTILMSLLQPAPEIFGIFDDVMLLANGQIVYHGPCKDVEEFFVAQGFKRPKRKGIADYLQEVISEKDQKQYWADKNQPHRFISAHEFAAAFKAYSTGGLMSQELESTFKKSESYTKSLSFDHFSLPMKDLLKDTLRFEILHFKKTFFIEAFFVIQLCLSGGFISAVFFRTKRSTNTLTGAQEYAGALFLVYLILSMLGFGEITLFSKRFPVLSKFREKQFYPPWAWAISSTLIKFPCGYIEAIACVGVVYYLVGFAPSAARFFRLILFMATMTQMAASLFRMIASLLRYPVVSASLGGFVLLNIVLQGGFVLQKSNIRKWWIWGYWAFPMSYGQNAIMVNEFLDHRWRKPLAGDSHTMGHRFILSQDLYDRGYWFWLGMLIVIGFTILYSVLLSIFLTALNPPSKGQTMMSKAQLNEWRKRDSSQIEGKSLERFLIGSRSLNTPSDFGSRSNSRQSNSPGATRARSSSTKIFSREGSPFSRSSKSQGGLSKFSQSINWGARGMVLPFQPYSISFKGVSYYVDMPKNYKKRGATEEKLQLLHDITGAFRPGVLTALVGVTGAGKSTLMDVLSGRKTRGYTNGDIRINGYPKRHETFTRIAGYCEQFDIHSTKLTVHESVTFSAWLRLDPEIEDEIIRDFIEEVIDLVELEPVTDAVVGVPGEFGLSIEQRKRLSIAIELVANPSIIFMDEPTSGLDARAAAAVMRAVRNTVDTGRTVVCTIHQPSIDIFESFDELLLLKRGGYVIYAGPLGTNSQHLISYFKSNANVTPIESQENPATWMLKVTQPGVEQKLGVDFANIYRQSSAFKDMESLVDSLSTPIENIQDIEFSTEYALSMYNQFLMCFWRQWRTYWRCPEYNLMRILLAIGIALLLGTQCWGWGRKLTTVPNIRSLIGVIYVSNAVYGVITCQAVQPVVYSERVAFYRERGARMYSALPFAAAQFLIEIPYILAASTIFHLIFFSMMRFPWDADKFFWIYYFQFSSQILHASLGLFSMALTPNPELGSALALTLIMMWSFSSGFALSLPSMPIWTKWLFWSNPHAMVIYGSIVSVVGKLDDIFLTTNENVVLSVKDYVQEFVGYKHSYLKLVASLAALFPFVCVAGFVLSIKYLNFQKR